MKKTFKVTYLLESGITTVKGDFKTEKLAEEWIKKALKTKYKTYQFGICKVFHN